MQLLAQREHSRVELRRKLLAHALAEEAQGHGVPGGHESDGAEASTASDARVRLDALLDWLEANQYLSQQRFAESRVHARASRFGNLRIRVELAQHDICLSPEALSSLKDTELARAREVWQRKYAGLPADASERAKQARFLAGRGFSGDVIRRVLRDAGPAAAAKGGVTPLDDD